MNWRRSSGYPYADGRCGMRAFFVVPPARREGLGRPQLPSDHWIRTC